MNRAGMNLIIIVFVVVILLGLVVLLSMLTGMFEAVGNALT
ncbi:MAG: hypothetical protein ABEI97_00825 [Candidatus Nanohaloarchaea archaeon]